MCPTYSGDELVTVVGNGNAKSKRKLCASRCFAEKTRIYNALAGSSKILGSSPVQNKICFHSALSFQHHLIAQLGAAYSAKLTDTRIVNTSWPKLA